MKKQIIIAGALALACLLGAQETPYPVLPDVVMLSTGRVLKKPVVRKCGAEMVVLAGTGWTQSVRYDALPDDVRSALEPFRPGGAQWFSGDTSANTIEIEGQIFVQTNGASSYKFGDTEVYLFDLYALEKFTGDGTMVLLPKPIHKTTTDADGKFKLRVPKNKPYFIFAQTSRFIAAGELSSTERYEWRVPMSAVRKGQTLRLASEFRYPSSLVQIEEQK
jgi:hypothetical protein